MRDGRRALRHRLGGPAPQADANGVPWSSRKVIGWGAAISARRPSAPCG
ncbi:Hypothetical protein I596_2978 [Dokdonella koreensis DS-123]|uniref:Uncharacterized protein n=1 Tax=Dokdonella koreensis DS-123 TaxID=1300342 RepID=A0A160DXF7_9GAMM|nr:Hypothetical protein I596_2978 [Dokdonella koreensis DS-123]